MSYWWDNWTDRKDELSPTVWGELDECLCTKGDVECFLHTINKNQQKWIVDKNSKAKLLFSFNICWSQSFPSCNPSKSLPTSLPIQYHTLSYPVCLPLKQTKNQNQNKQMSIRQKKQNKRHRHKKILLTTFSWLNLLKLIENRMEEEDRSRERRCIRDHF